MKKELKRLILKIRKEKSKQVFIYSVKEYAILWNQMADEMSRKGLYLGIMFADQAWCRKGYASFICEGIPIVLKGD